ncbi:MAG: PepSY domain-containing protein [Hyphomicrobiaceae bacterium]|nr:PepSY domain-containing protein [Hyphomicrobiaceae bacterium]
MTRLLAISLVALLAASPAYAAATCSTAPAAQWQPQSALEDMLKNEGYNILQVKVENGCYEVYATDANGNRANMAFNAETLEMLDNAEAGEN